MNVAWGRFTIVRVAGACALTLSGFSHHAAAFYCDNDALEDASQYYCGNDRGAYVLQPNGVSLWVSALDDDKPLVKVREPEAGGLMERILIEYLDVIDGEVLTGIGSNPHINAEGEAVVQAVTSPVDYPTRPPEATDWMDSQVYRYLIGNHSHTLLVSQPGRQPVIVATTGENLGSDTAICPEGIQPWPYIGDGGHYVFGAEVANTDGACDEASRGDADAGQGFQCPTEDWAVANSTTRARVTGLVAGAVPWGNPSAAREYTITYELLDGQTINPGERLIVAMPYAPFDPAMTPCDGRSYHQMDTTGWDHSVPNQLSYTIDNSNWHRYICGAEGCDVDLTEQDVFLFETSVNASEWPQDAAPSGVRAIARGVAGGAAPETILRAVTLPRSAEEVQMSVDASVSAGQVSADHPLNNGGAVKYWLRRASAISHTGRMVGPSGSTVINVGGQAAPQKIVFAGDTGAWHDGLNSDYWHNMIVHVDAAGSVSLVDSVDVDFTHLSGTQLTSDDGVLYRVRHNSSDEDLYSTTNTQGWVAGYSSGAPTGVLPTGADSAVAGEWYPDAAALWNTDTDTQVASLECANENLECSVFVSTDSPANADAWSARVTSSLQSDSTWTAIKTLAASGDLALRVQTEDLYDAMRMFDEETDEPSGNYAYFPFSSASLTPVGGGATTPLVTWPLELRKWTKSGGASVVFANGDVSPGGFSLMRGIPKHFSEGDGVIGAMVALESPYLGSAGGANDNTNPAYDESTEELFLDSILGDTDPCQESYPDYSGEGGTDYSAFNSIDNRRHCQAIVTVQNGEVTEIARTKGAEVAFGREDEPAATGVTGVEGFSFIDFGAAVAVSDTGTVFFNAQTRDLPDAAATDCTIDQILDQYGDNRHGVFAYHNGAVEKVIAEGDVIPLNGGSAYVKAIALPQPELRGAVAGDAIMLKMAVDTDGDCVEDTVGLVKATAPSSSDLGGDDPLNYTPDKGAFAAVANPYGGNVRIVNAAPETGWVLNSFRALDPADAEFLTEEQTSGGLYGFTATWCKTEFGALLPDAARPDTCPETLASLEATLPDVSMQLDIYMDIPPKELLGVIKDLADTPSLVDLATITETETGLKLSLSIADGSAFDVDPDAGELMDPFGAEILRAIVPTIPVPVFGQGLIMLLSGLMSLLGGVFVWRRKET